MGCRCRRSSRPPLGEGRPGAALGPREDDIERSPEDGERHMQRIEHRRSLSARPPAGVPAPAVQLRPRHPARWQSDVVLVVVSEATGEQALAPRTPHLLRRYPAALPHALTMATINVC